MYTKRILLNIWKQHQTEFSKETPIDCMKVTAKRCRHCGFQQGPNDEQHYQGCAVHRIGNRPPPAWDYELESKEPPIQS